VDALIEISDVTKRYEGATAAAVNAVSLEIGEGEAVAVMGPSGSGKSTLLIGLLTLMIAVVAALGVLNTVLLGTRERVHDLGVFKAVGMTPRQLTGMIVCWVAGPALAAAVIAVPAATAPHTQRCTRWRTRRTPGSPAASSACSRPPISPCSRCPAWS
jgi:ABC transporter